MRLSVPVLVLVALAPAPTDDPPASGRLADQQALTPYAGLVGAWRGTGLVRRGSARGAWTESAEWTWSLDAKSAALVASFKDGKYLKDARLRPADDRGLFLLVATLADGSRRTFLGRPDERDRLVLDAEQKPDSGLARITLTPLHETRLLLLLEAASPEGGPLTRLGEVGYTRQGVAFAAGDSYPVCIVTGGRGTTRVSFQGKDYWVCCSGCKELFDDDPAAIVAEAVARAKKK